MADIKTGCARVRNGTKKCKDISHNLGVRGSSRVGPHNVVKGFSDFAKTFLANYI